MNKKNELYLRDCFKFRTDKLPPGEKDAFVEAVIKFYREIPFIRKIEIPEECWCKEK